VGLAGYSPLRWTDWGHRSGPGRESDDEERPWESDAPPYGTEQELIWRRRQQKGTTMADTPVAERDQIVDLGDGRSVLYLKGETMYPDHVGLPSAPAELRDGAYQVVEEKSKTTKKAAASKSTG
jgi:hypothetical protein